ncbi:MULTISPECIES: hypothetical protein [unclassified Symbiopectobacterium]|uniref:hypothetical protein n=1 Tax=unclassified Symbiopectobacterium TaxID=2794573 RepID=UPI002226B0B3|nr:MULTISPECIES: hypothetical protein [unclassified Symbiopectobacterium]MCW2475838.1 hypothetical protein [Candidatus Symbiopectobacterium sp. NZEC151]MCW2485980.1 hypothetical protein [Candidatus Symbiopectobacterium sp. NZEC127]
MKSLLSFQFGDFRARIVEIFRVLTDTHGEKLTCSQLNLQLDALFSKEEGWTHLKGTSTYTTVEQTVYRSRQIEDTTYLITAPAHDLLDDRSNEAIRSGGHSAAALLEEIKKEFTRGNVKTLMPIAQSNPLGCFGLRGHFVLCEVDIHEGKIQTITLHDPKAGLIDGFYKGDKHLNRQFLNHESLGLDKKGILTAQHHGHQHLLNGNDCGRYTLYYVDTIVKTGSLTQASAKEAMAFFTARR